MIPYKTLLKLDKESKLPVYLKISNAIIEQISSGILRSGTRLPGSREMALLLGVHRKTVMNAYNELQAQGWIESRKTTGTFVSDKLPIIAPQKLSVQESIEIETHFDEEFGVDYAYRFGDGNPDIRLAPLNALAKEYSRLLKDQKFSKSLTYGGEITGDPHLKYELLTHLRDTRGIYISPKNLFITRGSMMAFYLIMATQLKVGELVIAGSPGYQSFNEIVKNRGGDLREIDVDSQGLNIDQIEAICQKEIVKMVFVIPHHHHPTSVTLSPERRLQLLELSKKYKFRIIEDDYDYEFHYESSPILPLMSLDKLESVIYIGSFSKAIAPSLRLGYVVAPSTIVQELAELRKLIDRTGDPVLERATAHLFKFGDIQRHLNKTLKCYRKRRDLFCSLLQELSDYVDFSVPEGGMAVWAKFKPEVNLKQMVNHARSEGLFLHYPTDYNSKTKDYLRLGFSSMNENEIKKGFTIFKKALMHSIDP